MAILTDGVDSKKENRFLSLEYSNISKFKKFYIFLRLHSWYDKISESCEPSSNDHDMIKAFLKDGIISDSDIKIMKLREKYYFLVSNDSILNAMRICA